MRGMAHQAAVLAVSRIGNYGLMIISPLLLVRYLTVHDFGRYREFLLYVSLLQTAAAFAISDSLLYFIPRYAASPWRVVRQTTILTAIVSLSVTGAFLLVDLLVPGGLVGPYVVQVLIYVLLFVNLDWWESLWVARSRPVPVLVYTGARLMARMVLVVCVAALTRDVAAMIWSLIALEAARFLGALSVWRTADRSDLEPPIPDMWREQLRFCVPFGLAAMMSLLSKNLGNVAIAKYLGVVALAQFTIGTYGEPIILALRNSISQVVLPELVRLEGVSRDAALRLWQRTTIVNCLLLFPPAAIVAWYAEPLVSKAFGAGYLGAVPVLRLYALVIVCSCFDFSPLLRAVNQTRPFIMTGIVAALANGLVLLVLLRVTGVVGAAVGLVASNLVTTLYLGFSATRLCSDGARLVPWTAVTKVLLCAVVGAGIAFGIADELGPTLLGVICGSVLYGAVFAGLLLAARVEEASIMLHRLRILVPVFRGR